MNRVMSAGLYELPRGILIHAYAPTKAGFLIAVEPSALLPPDAPDERVGAELIRVLKQEQPVRPTPHRSDYKDIGDPVLRAVGLRSWTEVQRDGRMCVVQIANERFRFIPTANQRTDGARAFDHLNDQVLEVQVSGPGEVGQAARTALARSVLA